MNKARSPVPTWYIGTPSTLSISPLGAYSTASCGQDPFGQQQCMFGYVQENDYNIMEERVKFFFLGQQTSLTVSQIFNLEPLIKLEQLKQIRLPLELKKFKVNLQVLHTCIYYVIGIEKSICCEGSIQFRQKCLAAISTYYISKKMNFEIYEYSYLCSRILSLPIEKIMHIIYFMIYARLASKPYINNVIDQNINKPKNSRKQTFKSEIQESIRSRSVDSRHFTVFAESNQMQIDIFRKDLKKILNSPSQKKLMKKGQNKRYFNLKKIYPDEDEDLFQAGIETNCNPFNNQSKKIVTIPYKVGSTDNSSIITRLKFTASKTQERQQCPYRKLQVRRQKFNEDFDYAKKYESLGQQEQQIKKVMGGTLKAFGDQSGKSLINSHKLQKRPYEYFYQMASTIKSKNKELDHIRSNCTVNSFKRINSKENEWTRQKNEGEIKLATTEGTSFGYSYHKWRHFNLTTESIGQKQNKNQFSLDEEGKKENLANKTSQQSLGEEKNKNGQTNQLVTRKNTQLSQDQEKLLLFNKKLKNKFKVQKYKEQYRQFLKTQMFERVRNII